MKKVTLIILSIMSFQAWSQEKIDLELKITNLKSTDGQVMVAVFNTKEDYLKNTFANASSPIMKEGEVSISFSLPKGAYAISVYHDKNNNGKMDSNFMGIPTESYGFSNDAPSRFGPADYEEAVFQVNESNTFHSIKIH